MLGSHDDSQINYSSASSPVDWRAKYYEVADMLAETRNELDEFQQSSKELEEELERELEKTEKAQQDLRLKVTRAESERDEWKSKFMALQTTHNTTSTSLQRELDKIRQNEQSLKVRLRDLEMGNDDLERSERAASSNLADTEAKYSRVLEEKILLEHELLNKAGLEEDCQRLKDELRDANVENTILKDQLAQSQRRPSLSSHTSNSVTSLRSNSELTDDALLQTPPPDLLLSDLACPEPSVSTSTVRPTESKAPVNSNQGQTALLRRTGLLPPSRIGSPLGASMSPPSALPRSTTLPSFSPTRIPSPNSPALRAPGLASRTSSTGSTNGGSKSKGVQMVSDMRARVRKLEDKLHTRVPRLRMGSLGRSAAQTAANAVSQAVNNPQTPVAPLQRRSFDVEATARGKTSDSSGWVLIMEENSPIPAKGKDRERRRTSSPTAPSAFRPMASTHGSAGQNKSQPSAATRRPSSRLSAASDSRTASHSSTATGTSSSIPTPTSRPATPTFLPVPVPGPGNTPFKRSSAGNLMKRSSLGASTNVPLPHTGLIPPSATDGNLRRPGSSLGIRQSKVLPNPPKGPPTTALSKSSIGRPASFGAPIMSRRKSNANELANKDAPANVTVRPRAGSSAAYR